MKKASDFYLQLKTNNNLKSYNSKYFKGKNIIDNNLRQKDSYDFIISLGHQLSFSCEVEKGLKEMTDLLNHKGYLVFDCWNEKTNISYDPEFKLEKINTDQLQKILYDLKLEVVFIGYGQKIFYFTPKLWLIIHRIIGRFLYPIVRFLENALWENKILAGNAQNIYCVARRK